MFSSCIGLLFEVLAGKNSLYVRHALASNIVMADRNSLIGRHVLLVIAN